jgi:NAD(P)-dependent dehydrogenase (short-subunit alcohol dehydrogenase family)
MDNSTSIEGQGALVTGASRGIGATIAQALDRAGARVARVSRSGEGFRADVSRVEEVERLAGEVRERLGPPTILVNAAGVFGPLDRLRDADPRRWLETISVDALGPYLTCRAFVGGMVDEGWGRILNVTSAASLHRPGLYGSAYATAKAALNQLTRHLAAELEGTGVTANVFHPGDVKTEMWEDIREQADRLGPSAEPLRQWVAWVEETGGDPPEKAADLVLRTLESDANGEFLWIDEPLQPPIPSWERPVAAEPWRE